MAKRATSTTSRRSKATDEVVKVDEASIPEPSRDAEMVNMWNPDTPGAETAAVTREAYREVWAAKGWRIVSHSERDAKGELHYTLEPALDPSEVPEEVDLTGDGERSTGWVTAHEADASSSAGSDAGSTT